MINVDYVPGVPNKTDGINIGLSVAQASRLRDLLLKYEVEGHVADDLRGGPVPRPRGRPAGLRSEVDRLACKPTARVIR